MLAFEACAYHILEHTIYFGEICFIKLWSRLHAKINGTYLDIAIIIIVIFSLVALPIFQNQVQPCHAVGYHLKPFSYLWNLSERTQTIDWCDFFLCGYYRCEKKNETIHFILWIQIRNLLHFIWIYSTVITHTNSSNYLGSPNEQVTKMPKRADKICYARIGTRYFDKFIQFVYLFGCFRPWPPLCSRIIGHFTFS